jgi:hypothetical protein
MAADYRLSDDGWIVRLADMAFIPPDPRNADRQRYDEWIEAGGVPDPYEPPPSAPGMVTAS